MFTLIWNGIKIILVVHLNICLLFTRSWGIIFTTSPTQRHKPIICLVNLQAWFFQILHIFPSNFGPSESLWTSEQDLRDSQMKRTYA